MAQSQDSNTLLDTSGLDNIKGARVAIVATEWNDKIVAEQIAGAERVLNQLQCTLTHKLYVPGSFELPHACKALYNKTAESTENPKAIIAFGAVIKGGTPHFDYVCKAVTEGITTLNIMIPIPVIFGVLTLDTEEQAWERLGGVHGHKGEEAAITALKMIQFNRKLKG